MLVSWFFSFHVLSIAGVIANFDNGFHKQGHSITVWAQEGGQAILPCDTSSAPDDRVNMVLWFKNNTEIPIYSFDARGGTSNAIHMAVSNLEQRYIFTVSEDHGSALNISKITAKDEGLYKCRIDFLNSPTRRFNVTLSIISMPSSPKIYSEYRTEVGEIAGPYSESEKLDLTCAIEGGKPTPKLTWWMNDEELFGFVQEYDDRLTNRLLIYRVPRSYNNQFLECHVNVTGAYTSIVKMVQLNVYVRPLHVSILNGDNPLIDGKSYPYTCDCLGSNPPASIKWLLDGEIITLAAFREENTENSTRSTLTIRPDHTFNGKVLTCLCENPEFPGFNLDDKRKIYVLYKPITKLMTKPKTNLNKTKEGDNVTLDCSVNSNPGFSSIVWYHNTELIEKSDVKTFYTITNVSLNSNGEYWCEATNPEGSTKSEVITMNVLHAPYCKKGSDNQTVLASVQETVVLQCDVESESFNRQIQFFWTFNTSKSASSVPSENVLSNGKTSILRYTPKNDDDYGTIACWSQNDVGHQKVPCYFHVVLAREPESPRNCNVSNISKNLKITCEPGFDGGVKQYFVLEIHASNDKPSTSNDIHQMNDQANNDVKTKKVVYSFQKENPEFDVYSLESGIPYTLVLYAANIKGKSEPVVMMQEIKSYNAARKTVPSEISALQDSVAIPAIYVQIIVALVVLIIFLVILTATILLCRRGDTVPKPKPKRELNNFRIVYTDVEGTRESSFDTEF